MRPKKNETTQDVILDNETVLFELDDGTRLVEIDDPESEDERLSYRVSTPYETITIDDERRAKLCFTLYAITDGFERPDRAVEPAIPISVVTEGRPAVATYLYAVRGWDSDHVADVLDVSRRTVWDYLSEVRKNADGPGDELKQ